MYYHRLIVYLGLDIQEVPGSIVFSHLLYSYRIPMSMQLLFVISYILCTIFTAIYTNQLHSSTPIADTNINIWSSYIVGYYSTPLIHLLSTRGCHRCQTILIIHQIEDVTLHINKIKTAVIRISASSEMKTALNSGLDSVL